MRAQKRCKMNDSIKQVFIVWCMNNEAFVLISGQFPALLHVLLAADRVMALCFPMWYRESPIFIRKQFLITVAVIVNIVSCSMNSLPDIHHALHRSMNSRNKTAPFKKCYVGKISPLLRTILD